MSDHARPEEFNPRADDEIAVQLLPRELKLVAFRPDIGAAGGK
jgi:hypothetical protein